jgi:hypothetical protein
MEIRMSEPRTQKPLVWFYLLAMLSMMAIACWSSNTLFISLTATPASTPTRETTAVDSMFQIGDTVVIVGQGIASIYLTQNPEPVTRRNRVPNAACYPNTSADITDVERVDGVTYYRVECNNALGWLAESNLRRPEGSE